LGINNLINTNIFEPFSINNNNNILIISLKKEDLSEEIKKRILQRSKRKHIKYSYTVIRNGEKIVTEDVFLGDIYMYDNRRNSIHLKFDFVVIESNDLVVKRKETCIRDPYRIREG
jgi:hypothetical protein